MRRILNGIWSRGTTNHEARTRPTAKWLLFSTLPTLFTRAVIQSCECGICTFLRLLEIDRSNSHLSFGRSWRRGAFLLWKETFSKAQPKWRHLEHDINIYYSHQIIDNCAPLSFVCCFRIHFRWRLPWISWPRPFEEAHQRFLRVFKLWLTERGFHQLGFHMFSDHFGSVFHVSCEVSIFLRNSGGTKIALGATIFPIFPWCSIPNSHPLYYWCNQE